MKKTAIFLSVLGFAWAALAAQPEDGHRAFDVEAQGAAGALVEFGRQARLQLLFSEDEVREVQTHAVRGNFEVYQALQLLLDGTPLRFEKVGEDVVSILREKEANAPETAMNGEGAAGYRVAQADVPQGTESEAASANGAEQGGAQLEEIVVTGTHIRGAAPVGSGVIVLDEDAIRRSGYDSLGQIIQTLPQNFSGGASPTLTANITRGFSELNQSNGIGINLRGLGNGATLTLLNGQRMAPAGQGTFVDISMIPPGAVERIEVLTDGASAVYGSDAIGGVVNIITKKDVDGAQTRLRYGSGTTGSRDEYSLGQLFGHSWRSGNITLNYDHHRAEALPSADRRFSADLPQPTDLLGEQKTDSAFVSLNQTLTADVGLNVGVFAARRDFKQYYSPDAAVTRVDSGDSTGVVASADLSIDFGETWQGHLLAVHSSNDLNVQASLPLNPIGADSTFRTQSAETRAAGDLLELPGGPVKLAVGAAFRSESGEYRGSASYDEERDVSSAYAEFLVPLLGGDLVAPGIKKLTLAIAGRIDDYSDFGSTTNPRYGLEWVPVAGLTARATYSESFRAPLFFEQQLPLAGLLVDVPDPQSMRPDGLSTTVLLNGGNLDLAPETAHSWTAGLDFRPAALPQLTASANYFAVRYRNQINELLEKFFFDVLTNPAATPFVSRGPSDASVTALVGNMPDGLFDLNTFTLFTSDNIADLLGQYDIGAVFGGTFQNAAENNVRGLDANIAYEQALAGMALDLGLNGTYLLENELRSTATSPGIQLLNTVFNPVDLKLRASAGLTSSRWQSSLFVNYVDRYRDPGVLGFTTGGDVPSWTTVDFQVRYRMAEKSWLRNADIALSATNLFDKDPPLINAVPLNLPYDAENANPLGRVISLSATLDW